MSTNDVEHYPQVCIIESPSGDDVLDGRNEGEALSKTLSLAGVQNNYYPVNDSQSFDDALNKMESDTAITMQGSAPQFPIAFIHISAHGNEDAVEK